MKNYNNFSTSPLVASRKYPKRVRKSTEHLIDNQLNESNSRAIVRPSITNVICINDYSVSVMTNEPNYNVSTTNSLQK